MTTVKLDIKKIINKENLMWNISLAYALIPILVNMDQPHFLIVLASTLLLVVLYISMIHLNSKVIEWVGWLYFIVYILLFSYFSLGMSMFLFYQTNLMTFRYDEPYGSKKWLSIYLELIIILAFAFFSGNARILLVLGPIYLFAFGLHYSFKHYIEQDRLKAQITAQNESINNLLAENERNRISRDLHDTLGHVFSMMTIKGELTLALLESGNLEEAKQELLSLQQISKETTQNVRKIIHNLQEQSIEDEVKIVSQMLVLSGLSVSTDGIDLASKLNSRQQHILSMILRELVTNVLKHSRASYCNIRFSMGEQSIIFEVADNGIGFETITGKELHTVRARLSLLQAKMHFVTYRPAHIRINIPLTEGSE